MNIAALRLHNQQITEARFDEPEQVVAWLGGMQGQDYPGAKRSIGLRLVQATDVDVTRAINEGKIVRAWPMRGTLHFVAAADVRWMLMLTSPKNIAASATRREVFIKVLQGGKQKSRDAMYAAPFTALNKIEKKRFAEAAKRYGAFLNKPAHLLTA